MFGANGASPFEIRWKMLGVHFRVGPSFWLLCVLFFLLSASHYNTAGEIALHFAILAACLFISFLAHDLGHVLVGRFFGGEGNVLIAWGSGGGAGTETIPKRWQRILVYLAGPFASLLLAAIAVFNLVVLTPYIPPAARPIYDEMIGLLIVWNVFWCILNLLPIWGYDAGRITLEIGLAISPRWGAVGAMVLSAAICAVVAVASYTRAVGQPLLPWLPIGGMFWAVAYAMLFVSNLMNLPALIALGRRPRVTAKAWSPPARDPRSIAPSRWDKRTFEQMD
jgi:Zn-dependent protease